MSQPSMDTENEPPYETVIFEVQDDHVATITLNRPEVLNAFNQQMCDEFSKIWNRVRLDDAIHAVVLRAAGDRAFSTGVDRRDGVFLPENPWSQVDPGAFLSPKLNGVWKPIVCAVHGMAAGGAFYWINQSDIIICSDDATFFDPHVSYRKTSSFEPIGLTRRIVPLGEVLRMVLLGLTERISADRALQIGIVSEVVRRDELWDRAHELAATIAGSAPGVVQATLKAVWSSLDQPTASAYQTALMYCQLGNEIAPGEWDPMFESGVRPEWNIR
jgi:enoyl-CoA hydratase/carnithine racemase